MTALPQLLTADELAGELGQTKRWVYRQLSERQMPGIRLGRSVLFDPAAVCAWLQAQRSGDWSASKNGDGARLAPTSTSTDANADVR